jgi:hypothetical protein
VRRHITLYTDLKIYIFGCVEEIPLKFVSFNAGQNLQNCNRRSCEVTRCRAGENLQDPSENKFQCGQN